MIGTCREMPRGQIEWLLFLNTMHQAANVNVTETDSVIIIAVNCDRLLLLPRASKPKRASLTRQVRAGVSLIDTLQRVSMGIPVMHRRE